MKKAFWLAIVLLANAPAFAQAPLPDPIEIARLDGFARGMASADKFSGVVLVANRGTLLFERGYGRIDPAADDSATITTDTRLNIASAGKMFTSVAILQQIAAGKLTLDSRIGDVIKDYPNAEFRKITVRQLLTHSAGAGSIDLFGAEFEANRQKARTVAQMVALHADRAPTYAPGSKQEYDNFGFVVLGRMIELLSGQSYEDYIGRRIFAPAGMTRTGFVDCMDPAPDIAIGYAEMDGKTVRNCVNAPKRGFPAGGEVSTAGDMWRFVEALRTGKLIPPALFAEATKTQKEFMGLGFFATDYGPGIPKEDFRWGHGGSHDGISADVRHYPLTGETVVILANRSPPDAFRIAGFLHDARKTK